MKKIKDTIKRFLYQFKIAKLVFRNRLFYEVYKRSKIESKRKPSRTKIINHLLSIVKANNYLEIGVRNPEENFNKIFCSNKYSVDPGDEFIENPVDFKLTSDDFFTKLGRNQLGLLPSLKFDVIFIDGLHLADQVERDILNSLNYITDIGFIVLHDCNPPTEFHQRENYKFKASPAKGFWNGTGWKTFYKFRHRKDLYSLCFDSDWGVGVISKKKYPEFSNLIDKLENPYFEYNILNLEREKHLNLQSFDEWIKK